MNDIEDRLTAAYSKGRGTLMSIVPWPALLILVAWNLIEWLICLFLGRSLMLWLCGSLLDSAVNCAVILFMVHHRKWNDCWVWAIALFVFNTVPCFLPLELGNGYIVDILILLIQIFIICMGDIIGNIVIAIAIYYYPLEYDGVTFVQNTVAKIQKRPVEVDDETQPQQEPENPYIGGFSTNQAPIEMDFGGFGGYTATEEKPEDHQDEPGGGFGGGFS